MSDITEDLARLTDETVTNGDIDRILRSLFTRCVNAHERFLRNCGDLQIDAASQSHSEALRKILTADTSMATRLAVAKALDAKLDAAEREAAR